MDKELFYHTVATETAKAYVSNNMPLYINSGSANYAKDFAEKYIEASGIKEIVKNVFQILSNQATKYWNMRQARTTLKAYLIYSGDQFFCMENK